MSEPILDRIQKDLVTAMKAQDADSLSTLRMLKAAIMEAKTRLARDAAFGPDDEIAVLKRYVKQRREAIVEMEKAGDAVRKAREEREIELTARYLPAQMSEADLEKVVAEVVASTGASGPKDAGKAIGAVLARVKGQADGGMVARLVKAKLGA
jgi:uncharacterized protein YqeY